MMKIPDWALRRFRFWNDLSLARKALIGGGYTMAVLQERQHRKRTMRRRKILRAANKNFHRLRDGMWGQ